MSSHFFGNKEKTENSNDETNNAPHQSIISNLLDMLNTDFPLSGGETQSDFEGAIESTSEVIHKAVEEMDQHFPLSGA